MAATERREHHLFMARFYHGFFELPLDGFLEWDRRGQERTPGDMRGQKSVKKSVDGVFGKAKPNYQTRSQKMRT
jgi:hypothetical protein